MEIVLVKRTDVRLEGQMADAVRTFLFEHLDGASANDKKNWRRFVRALHEAGSGEFFTVKTTMRRQGWFHRKHMAMMGKVFAAQERIDTMEAFRLWTKVGSGFVDWVPGPKGGVFPVPKSINFDRCEEGEMRQFHEDVVAFLRTPHAQHYLWPKATPADAERGMEAILQPFERQHENPNR